MGERNKYLTERDRYTIEILLKEKYKVKEIAQRLNKCQATIYNEIKRGTVILKDTELREYSCYCADVAQRKYIENCKNKGRDYKIGNDYEFAEFIERKIVKGKYSPEAALSLAKRKHFKTSICFKTLYNYIDAGVFLKLTNKDLPVKKNHPRRIYKKVRVALMNRHGKSIAERPSEAQERACYGHWELDTVQGGKGLGSACLLVLSERMTRQELIFKIRDKSSNSVVSAFDEYERKIGYEVFQKTFKTITSDNGSEFLNSDGIERSAIHPEKKRTHLYYAHPYSAYERGTNENINKMIRRWIPKGASIEAYSSKFINFVQCWINNYPRKSFGYQSTDGYKKTLGLTKI